MMVFVIETVWIHIEDIINGILNGEKGVNNTVRKINRLRFTISIVDMVILVDETHIWQRIEWNHMKGR